MAITNGGIRLGVFGNLAIAKEQKDAVKNQNLLRARAGVNTKSLWGLTHFYTRIFIEHLLEIHFWELNRR